MKIIHEDIWQFHGPGSWIGVTTNHSVKKDGCNVMGKGIAREAADRYPQLPFLLGTLIKKQGRQRNNSEGKASVFVFASWNLFTFNVKNTWQEPAELELIEHSCQELVRLMAL